MVKNLKIIIDTNIWLSYFLKKRSFEIIDLVEIHNLVLYSDIHLRNELIEVINRAKFKKYFTEQSINDALQIFDGLTTFVNTEKVYIGSPDSKDNFLFDLAFQTNSKIIVTGDRKILDFEVKGIKIISLSSFKRNEY